MDAKPVPISAAVPSGESAQSPTTAVPVVDFSRQYAEIRVEILAAIEQVCTGQHFILGEEVRQFEAHAAKLCGVNEAIGCASGTDALWLALAAAKVGPGDSVITTPFSFFATVSSILRVGAQPVLVDIDPRTFNLSADLTRIPLQSAKRGSSCAILPVDLYGQCGDWDAFRNLKQERDCWLIEDAAQAFGAKWNGQPAGNLGDVAAFSFYPTKNLSAYGDAGMVTTDDEALAERCRILRVHGMRQRYYHDEVGWNSRMDTLQAAVLLVKLRYIDTWNQQRREHAARYDRLFRESGLVEGGPYPMSGVVLPYCDPRARHVFHQYAIRVVRRDELKAFLAQQHIGSEVYYPVPLHLQKSLQFLGYQTGDLPESERAAAEVLALPMFPELRHDEQQRVVAAIASFLS